MKNLIYTIENKGGTAEIRLTGYIGGWEANSEAFMQHIDQLIDAGVQDLEMYINSFGGSVLEANEIINQLRRFNGTKTAQVGALAASAASYLLPYFHKVKAFKNSQIMMHDPIMHIEATSEADFDSKKQQYVNAKKIVIDAYDKKMKSTREEIEDMMSKTTWLNADQSKNLGLVDEVLEDDDTLPDNTTKIKNLYNNLPTQIVNAIDNPVEKTQTEIEMKQVLKALGLPENATEEQAVQLVNGIKENANKAITALATSKGMNAERIAKLSNADFDTTLEMVVDHKVETPKNEVKPDGEGAPKQEGGSEIDKLVNALKGGQQGEKEKKFEDYSPVELENLFETDREKYDRLHKEAYG